MDELCEKPSHILSEQDDRLRDNIQNTVSTEYTQQPVANSGRSFHST